MSIEIGIKRLFMSLFIIWAVICVPISVFITGLAFSEKYSGFISFIFGIFTFVVMFLTANIPFLFIWLPNWLENKVKETSYSLFKTTWIISILLSILGYSFVQTLEVIFSGIMIGLPFWFILLVHWVVTGFAQGAKNDERK